MNLKHFYSLGSDDQQQYFGKTYFQVYLNPEKKEKSWVWCNGFAARNIGKFNLDAQRMGHIDAIDLKENPPDFTFPATGLYNLKNSTVFLQRIPARQSKKGLCRETGKLTSFQDNFHDKDGRYLIPITVPDLWRMANIQEMFRDSHKFTLADSMVFFKRNRSISFAVDIEFGLSLGIESKYLSLWYKQILIGEVPSPRKIVLHPDCMFKQEVVDRFLPEGIQIGEGK